MTHFHQAYKDGTPNGIDDNFFCGDAMWGDFRVANPGRVNCRKCWIEMMKLGIEKLAKFELAEIKK